MKFTLKTIFNYPINHYPVLALIMLVSACDISDNRNTLKGNREYLLENREIKSFEEIVVKGDFDVLLKEAEIPRIEIEADANLHNYIYTEVDGKKLIISQPDNISLKTLRSIKVVIHHQGIDRIEMIGRTELLTEDILNFDTMEIELIGSSKAKMELNGKLIKGIFPGSSNIELRGKAEEVNLDFPGAAWLDASDLKVNTFDLSMEGAGKADIFVNQYLKVNIAGAALVNYEGNPQKVQSSIGGLGRLNNKDD